MFKMFMIFFGISAAGATVYTAIQPDNPLVEKSKSVMAQHEISSIARAVTTHALGKGRAPANQQDFTKFLRENVSGADPTKDPWGRPYVLERKANGGSIRSFGPDGKRGTADDLVEEFQALR